MSPSVPGRRIRRRPHAILLSPSAMVRTTWPLRLALIVAASVAVLIPFTARSEPTPAHIAGPLDPWSQFVAEAAERFAIPAGWIRAVMHVESGGNVKAVSSKRAVAPIDIMPATHAPLRLRCGLRSDPYDPPPNTPAGCPPRR